MLLLAFVCLLPLAIAHCGPHDVASYLSEGVCDYLAKDMAPLAEEAYDLARKFNPIANSSITHRSIELGCNVTAPYWDRVNALADSIREIRNGTKTTRHMIFLARRALHQSEHWLQDMQLLGMPPQPTLKKLFSIPWTQSTRWTNGSMVEKILLFKHALFRMICDNISLHQLLGHAPPSQ